MKHLSSFFGLSAIRIDYTNESSSSHFPAASEPFNSRAMAVNSVLLTKHMIVLKLLILCGFSE
jgi:hypothetical protein